MTIGDELDAKFRESGFVFHKHSVETLEREEGYREFRCLPATWSYSRARPLLELAGECYAERKGDDPHGKAALVEFWSGSDAAVRLQGLPTSELALRELTAMATRRSVGVNAPRPWVSWPEVKELAAAWNEDASHPHFTEVAFKDPIERSLWDHSGMRQSIPADVVHGYGIKTGDRRHAGFSHRPWGGGRGAWYSWETIRSWQRWPRRQDATAAEAEPVAGRLLLFVSHRWEALEHPDPQGAQLEALRAGLLMALASAILGPEDPEKQSTSGLPELLSEFLRAVHGIEPRADEALVGWATTLQVVARGSRTEAPFLAAAAAIETPAVRGVLKRVRDSVLLWYDYSSMLQAPRSQAEEASFRAEIRELNDIQAPAATLILAGNDEYLWRAWCFLELCGAMRGRVLELVPSWGQSVGAVNAHTSWGSRSDQLIGALNLFGIDAIAGSGLKATHPEDLRVVASLLSRLPLLSMLETADSDLIGGVLPFPFRDQMWTFDAGPRYVDPTIEWQLPAVASFGVLPTTAALRTAQGAASADSLAGDVGIWVYTTQRALTLAWAARAPELWERLREAIGSAPDIQDVLGPALDGLDLAQPSVAALWADPRSLAEDGLGWTRVAPSSAKILVVLTQADLPTLCRMFDELVRAHLAQGVTVISFSPDSGQLRAYLPSKDRTPRRRRAHTLAVPRARRSYAPERRLFVPHETQPADVELWAALRLDPELGPIGPARVGPAAAEAGFGRDGQALTPADLLSYSAQRVYVEALCRTTTASWETWCSPRIGHSQWQVGLGPMQLQLMEGVARASVRVGDNPLLRQNFVYFVAKDHVGYCLPPDIVDHAEHLAQLIAEREAAEHAAGEKQQR